jgi:hypothetical protein
VWIAESHPKTQPVGHATAEAKSSGAESCGLVGWLERGIQGWSAGCRSEIRRSLLKKDESSLMKRIDKRDRNGLRKLETIASRITEAANCCNSDERAC